MDFFSKARRLFGLAGGESAAERAYRALADFSRNPHLYRGFGVPDTFDGRFDALVFHVAIYLAALRAGGKDSPAVSAFARGVSEAFLADMDRALREAGRGDLAIGKEVKRMASAFYGRLASYEQGLADKGERALAEAIGRNIFRGRAVEAATLQNLAKYARLSYTDLKKRPLGELVAGRVEPNPFPVRP